MATTRAGWLAVAAGLVVGAALAPVARAQDDPPAEPAVRTRFDLASVQALLAVQNLDGWLLYDNEGQNPIAGELVNPEGHQTRRWFYFIPSAGQPVAIVHKVEASQFDRVPGRKIEYGSWRDLDRALSEILDGADTIAMEYSERAAVPKLSRVDAGTLEMIRAKGVKVRSSAELVQLTKSIWGPDGRASHYVAVHHLTALREEALALVARKVRIGADVTEYDVQQFLVEGYKVRGLVGAPPIVAANANAADPHYRPTAQRSATLREGDLLLLDMWAKSDQPGAIYADITWMAYVGDEVPNRYVRAFAAVAQARDATVALIKERVGRRRPVKGFEADQQARSILGKAGYAEQFIHRTGHSIDTSVHGAGANLDDYETHDIRNLVPGTGFSVEPGVYVKGDFGVRSEIDVFIGVGGVEVTTPLQTEITPILRAPAAADPAR